MDEHEGKRFVVLPPDAKERDASRCWQLLQDDGYPSEWPSKERGRWLSIPTIRAFMLAGIFLVEANPNVAPEDKKITRSNPDVEAARKRFEGEETIEIFSTVEYKQRFDRFQPIIEATTGRPQQFLWGHELISIPKSIYQSMQETMQIARVGDAGTAGMVGYRFETARVAELENWVASHLPDPKPKLSPLEARMEAELQQFTLLFLEFDKRIKRLEQAIKPKKPKK